MKKVKRLIVAKTKKLREGTKKQRKDPSLRAYRTRGNSNSTAPLSNHLGKFHHERLTENCTTERSHWMLSHIILERVAPHESSWGP